MLTGVCQTFFFFFFLTALYIYSSLENKNPGLLAGRRPCILISVLINLLNLNVVMGCACICHCSVWGSLHPGGNPCWLCVEPQDSKTFAILIFFFFPSWRKLVTLALVLLFCSKQRGRWRPEEHDKRFHGTQGKVSVPGSVFFEVISALSTNDTILHAQAQQQDPVSSSSAFLSLSLPLAVPYNGSVHQLEIIGMSWSLIQTAWCNITGGSRPFKAECFPRPPFFFYCSGVFFICFEFFFLFCQMKKIALCTSIQPKGCIFV